MVYILQVVLELISVIQSLKKIFLF